MQKRAWDTAENEHGNCITARAVRSRQTGELPVRRADRQQEKARVQPSTQLSAIGASLLFADRLASHARDRRRANGLQPSGASGTRCISGASRHLTRTGSLSCPRSRRGGLVRRVGGRRLLSAGSVGKRGFEGADDRRPGGQAKRQGGPIATDTTTQGQSAAGRAPSAIVATDVHGEPNRSRVRLEGSEEAAEEP